MKKTNLNITQSKKIISDYAGQIKDVIRNNKIIVKNSLKSFNFL